MIKPEELRIWNYILGIIEDDDDHVEESICRVISLDKIPMSNHHIWVESCSGIDAPEYYDFFIGIPLTEQWLIDFGFYKKSVWMCLDGVLIGHITTDDHFQAEIGFPSMNHLVKWKLLEIKYVHQLQNIYFALTGEELTRKEVPNG